MHKALAAPAFDRSMLIFSVLSLALVLVTWLSPVHSLGFHAARLLWFGFTAWATIRIGGRAGAGVCAAAAVLIVFRLTAHESAAHVELPGGWFLDPLYLGAALYLAGRHRPSGTTAPAIPARPAMTWEFQGQPQSGKIEIKESSEVYLDAARAFLERLEGPLVDLQAEDDTRPAVVSLGDTLERFRDYVQPVRVTRVPLDLNAGVTKVAGLVQAAVPAMRIEFQLAEKEVTAAVAPETLEQICLPLIENAVAAAGPEGRVTVSTFAHSGGACISVSDTGPGVPDEAVDRIFLPFHTTRQGADGMGLAIVLRTVRALGARLTVSNRPGEGCTFTVTFDAPAQTARAARFLTQA